MTTDEISNLLFNAGLAIRNISNLDDDEIKYWVETLLLHIVENDETRATEILELLYYEYE